MNYPLAATCSLFVGDDQTLTNKPDDRRFKDIAAVFINCLVEFDVSKQDSVYLPDDLWNVLKILSMRPFNLQEFSLTKDRLRAALDRINSPVDKDNLVNVATSDLVHRFLQDHIKIKIQADQTKVADVLAFSAAMAYATEKANINKH